MERDQREFEEFYGRGSGRPGTSRGRSGPGQRPAHRERPGQVQLTAWTVTRLADGDIYVQIRRLGDPAALQARLRADGLPASVTFDSQPNPACRPYPADTALLERVFPQTNRIEPPPAPEDGVTVINPSGLPAGAGVRLPASISQPPADSEVPAPVLVQASPACAGG